VVRLFADSSQTTRRDFVARSVTATAMTSPIARGPLVDWHRQNGATLALRNGWEMATNYRHQADARGTVLVDLSHLAMFEINGPGTGPSLIALCGVDVPLRNVHSSGGRDIYRLTPTRAIVFGSAMTSQDSHDVTGGWATLSLRGADAERILSKVTAVDLRERTLPSRSCCQGPTFGVNTLFGRFADRFDLHVASDSVEFFWEVLLDAGAEFGLRPAGVDDIP